MTENLPATCPIAWQLYPLGFTGAAVRPGNDNETELCHRLRHINNWVDYAADMGFNSLVLGPIFTSSTHGYDTLDFLEIDPRLGTEDDFKDLAQHCHSRGLGLILDGVFNHVGSEHPLVQQALAEGPDGELAGLFSIDFSGDKPTPANFEGHPGLVEFNHNDPRVQELVADTMIYWLDRGATGWRLDAVYAVPADFWPKVVTKVKQTHPDAFIFGEMIHGDYADYVATSTIDSVTEYELWKATWSSLKEGNFFELQWTFGRHNMFAESFVPMTFVGNHDTTRIATYTSPEKAVLAAVVLFTVAGHPIVYYGDERAFEATKLEKIGGDDQVRPMYPATPDDADPSEQWMVDIHRELIALRSQRLWLTNSWIDEKHVENTRYEYDCVERCEDGRRISVVLDISDYPTAIVTENGEEIFRYPTSVPNDGQSPA